MFSGRDKKSKKPMAAEAAPSPHGIRVVPKINEAMRNKAAQAAAAKARKEGKLPKKTATKVEPEEKDEFDMMVDDKDLNTSLSEKLGFKSVKAETGKGGSSKPSWERERKKASGGGKGGKKKKGGANPWESNSGSDSDEDSDSFNSSTPTKKKGKGKFNKCHSDLTTARICNPRKGLQSA